MVFRSDEAISFMRAFVCHHNAGPVPRGTRPNYLRRLEWQIAFEFGNVNIVSISLRLNFDWLYAALEPMYFGKQRSQCCSIETPCRQMRLLPKVMRTVVVWHAANIWLIAAQNAVIRRALA